jgi:primosomal protein N'
LGAFFLVATFLEVAFFFGAFAAFFAPFDFLAMIVVFMNE